MPKLDHIYQGASDVPEQSIGENVRKQIDATLVRTIQEFGVQDHKGRMIGGCAETWQITTVAITDKHRENAMLVTYDGHRRYVLPPGTYYCYSAHAVRNRAYFGASQPIHWYSTKEERDAAVAKYFVNAAKRAKRAGPT